MSMASMKLAAAGTVFSFTWTFLALAFFSFAFSPARADAGEVDEELAIVIELAALISLERTIGIIEAVTADYTRQLAELAEQKLKTDDEHDKIDHALLKDIVWAEDTERMKELYAGLSAADALSFVEELSFDKFAEQNPGYRRPSEGKYIDFADAYKERIEKFQKYGYGAVAANNKEASDAASTQAEIARLKNASLAAKGYRQAIQAHNQSSNFMNREIVRIKLAIARQIELETKFALNERQERADVWAAFGQALGLWKKQGQAGGY